MFNTTKVLKYVHNHCIEFQRHNSYKLSRAVIASECGADYLELHCGGVAYEIIMYK